LLLNFFERLIELRFLHHNEDRPTPTHVRPTFMPVILFTDMGVLVRVRRRIAKRLLHLRILPLFTGFCNVENQSALTPGMEERLTVTAGEIVIQVDVAIVLIAFADIAVKFF